MDDEYTAVIPKRLADLIRERGLDPEALVVDALIEKLGLDPDEEAAVRIELAERFLEEAKKYIEQNDAVQASEKLYRAAEECIKALAQRYRVPELGEAAKKRRLGAWTLEKAATRLAQQLGEERIKAARFYAYGIHVWGFHEAEYGIGEVRYVLPYVGWLLQYTKKALAHER